MDSDFYYFLFEQKDERGEKSAIINVCTSQMYLIGKEKLCTLLLILNESLDGIQHILFNKNVID